MDAGVRPTTKRRVFYKYSAHEDAALFDSLAAFCKAEGLGTTKEAVHELIETKGWQNYRGFWTVIAQALPQRSAGSVAVRAIRTLNRNAKQGEWTTEEEKLLQELYTKHSGDLQAISAELGRLPNSVKDKVRVFESTNCQRLRANGRESWTFDQDRELAELVFKATNGFEFSVPEGGSFWVELAKLTGTRNYSQCRKRWGRALALDVRKVGRWNPGEDWRLLNNIVESEWGCFQDILWFTVCTGLPYPPDVAQVHFHRLLRRYHIDYRHDPFDEVLEKLADPLKKAYDAWVEAGEPDDIDPIANERLQRIRKILRKSMQRAAKNKKRRRESDSDVEEEPPLSQNEDHGGALTDDERYGHSAQAAATEEEDSSDEAQKTSSGRKGKKKKRAMKEKEKEEREKERKKPKSAKTTKQKEGGGSGGDDDEKKKDKKKEKENKKKNKKKNKKTRKRRSSTVQAAQEEGELQAAPARPTKKRKIEAL